MGGDPLPLCCHSHLLVVCPVWSWRTVWCQFWENAGMHSNLTTNLFSKALIHETTIIEDNVQHICCLLSLLLIICIYLCSSGMPSRQLSFSLKLCLQAIKPVVTGKQGASKHLLENDCTETTDSCWVTCMHWPARRGWFGAHMYTVFQWVSLIHISCPEVLSIASSVVYVWGLQRQMFLTRIEQNSGLVN